MEATTANPGTAGGNREDLRDDITVLEPQETPYTSLVEKRGEVSAMLVETISDRFRAPRTGGFPEGKAGGKGNNQSFKRGRFGVYLHKSMDEWAVTREQKLLAQRGGVAGITNFEDHERARTTLQVKRDMESANCSDVETQDGLGGAADMRTRGNFAWIAASGHSPTIKADFLPIGGDPDTTSSTIHVHGQTAAQCFNETEFNHVGKNLTRVHGTKKGFTIIAGDNVVETIDNFSRVIARATALTPLTAEHYTHPVMHYGEEYQINLMVNLYESSFWRTDVVPTQFNKLQADATGDPNAALGLFMDVWYVDMLEDLNEAEYWENAGGCGGAIQASWANVCKSPRGNAKWVTA